MTQLWMNNGGQITCTSHAGHYLTSAINARPKAITHHTPLDTWTSADDLGFPCEECTYS